MDNSAPLRFEALPRRLFLDSSILQTLQTFAEYVFDGAAPDFGWPALALRDDLEALRAIFLVNERAMFEFVLSENSLAEVLEKRDFHYTRWAHDVLGHWSQTVECYADGAAFIGYGRDLAATLDGTRFGFLSEKDRVLLKDSVALECDVFLTMEKKLPKCAPAIEAGVGVLVVRPPEYWALLAPWAALYS